MAIPTNVKKKYYTEAEAAQALNIFLSRLRSCACPSGPEPVEFSSPAT